MDYLDFLSLAWFGDWLFETIDSTPFIDEPRKL